jgi:hypothetical protein
MAGRRKARHVRHLGTGNESKACGPGQSEQLLEPFAGHFLDDRFSGSAGVNGRILIPRRRQPVGGKRGGQGATDDPAKETAARAADNPSLSIANQIIDDLYRVHAILRQATIEAGSKMSKLTQSADRPMSGALQMMQRVVQSPL